MVDTTTQKPPRSPLPPAARVGLLLLVAAGAVWLYSTGAVQELADQQRLERLLQTVFPWGLVAFIAIFAVGHVVGVPSPALVVLAGMALPVLPAVMVSWLGSMAGTLLAFSVARGVGRDWIAARLPERIRRIEARVDARPVLAVALVRLFTFLPPPADWFFALSRVRTRDFCVGTGLGVIPPIVVLVLAGDLVLRWMQ